MTWRTRRVKLLAGVAVAGLGFVPIGGLPLWSRVFSFYPNPSLPMLGLVCAALGQRFLGLELLARADWRATWIFGAVTGTILYLHSMTFGAIDLYYWGWERDSAAWVLAAVTTGFLARGNRFGLVLLAALMAYAVGALESENCWDYVMDPFYWLFSLGATATATLAAIFRALNRFRISPLRKCPAGAEPPLVIPAAMAGADESDERVSAGPRRR